MNYACGRNSETRWRGPVNGSRPVRSKPCSRSIVAYTKSTRADQRKERRHLLLRRIHHLYSFLPEIRPYRLSRYDRAGHWRCIRDWQGPRCGIGRGKRVLEEDFDDAVLTRLFNINLFAGLRIVQSYAKALRESHKRGRL